MKLKQEKENERRRGKKKEERKETTTGFHLSVLSPRPDSLYIHSMRKKRKEERDRGSEEGWKEEGRVGKLEMDRPFLFLNKRKLKSRGNALPTATQSSNEELLLRASYV